MRVLRTLAGLTLGPTLVVATLDAAAPLRLLTSPMSVARITAPARRAEVSVSFDSDGRIAAATLVRSTGSRVDDAQARQAALQLADLQPAGAAAGRTLVFRIALD
jgi:outer membrane biosynthesis protein TonB